MLTSQPLVACVAATDPSRARTAYRTTLGLRVVKTIVTIVAATAGLLCARVAQCQNTAAWAAQVRAAETAFAKTMAARDQMRRRGRAYPSES